MAPILLTIGVILIVLVLFSSKLSIINAAINMLIFVEEKTDQQLYEQILIPIVNNEEEEPTETDIIYPEYGVKFAQLTIQNVNIVDAPIFNCDDYSQLKYGWGRSLFSRYPGEGGKIIMAGHLVYYRRLIYIKIGSEVKVKTPYGSFYYKVNNTKIVDKADTTTMLSDDSKEQLVLYICYPNGELGTETTRFIVTCDYVRGPFVKNIPFKD